jgi:hypothetical protein
MHKAHDLKNINVCVSLARCLQHQSILRWGYTEGDGERGKGVDNMFREEIRQKFTCCCHDQDMERRGCNRIDTLAQRRNG